MSETRTMKCVEDSAVEQSYLLMPKHINGSGRLFGGQLVQWIDEIAGIVAKRHAETDIVTACIDNLRFKAGAYLNDTVVICAKIVHVGRSSMEVRVDSYRETIHGIRTMINRAYVVMVGVDENGKSVKVPGLVIENEVQKAEWEAAEKRAEYRKLRQHEGF